MPFLALVHLRDLRCPDCGNVLARAGARSFVVDKNGEALYFSESEPPEAMRATIACPAGHRATLHVPGDISAEETLATPDEAPIAHDAVFEQAESVPTLWPEGKSE